MAFRTRQFDARRGRLRASESLAGWVFADMLLVLFIVGVGSAAAVKAPEPVPEDEDVAVIVGMKPDPVSREFRVDGSGLLAKDKDALDDVCVQLKKQFRKNLNSGGEAAFVLTFAGGESGTANEVSRQVNRKLGCAGLKPDATPRAYWDGRDLDSLNHVRVEIFFYVKQELS